MNPFLNSAFYEDVADKAILNSTDLRDTIKSMSLYSKNHVVYCKTDYVLPLLEHIRLSSRKYSIITHHSDYSVDDKMIRNLPKNVVKWFAINAQCDDPRICPIPLGTKTPKGRAYHEERYDIEWLAHNFRSLAFFHRKTEDVVYCNWSITNLDRIGVTQKLNVPHHNSSGLTFVDYCKDMAKYRFVISPPGNGIDNHRTWEAIYLGCIPIVIRNSMYDAWPKLPIIQVNDYSEVSAEMLEDARGKYADAGYDLSMAFQGYWEQQIKNSINV